MPSVKGRPPTSGTWKPGQSGNPSGRPKRKPITDAFRAALNMPVSATDSRTLLTAIKDRMAKIIVYGDDKHALRATELLLDRLEGKPDQTVELQFEDALVDISARTGAPIDWLRKKSREIAARHLRPVDASYIEVETGMAPAADGTRAIMAVRRQRRETGQ